MMIKMNEINIDKKMFIWLLEKFKDLKTSEKKEISIDKYTLIADQIWIKVFFDRLYDEFFTSNSIHPKISTESIAKDVIVEFLVYGLYKDCYTFFKIYVKDDTFKMYTIPDIPKNTINKFLNTIENEIGEGGDKNE